MVTLSSKGL
ncbi:hypothetical protein GQ607_006298 [Colletotrichum asianum]|uniref:Uncharacterized protein n=1 Tax=Colletotrichum asianum TaxID=702518 RepID=A0A8H3WEA8_9PEZI|nr:hypothetical protein GQ607_012647 [Colletotrichum asianum]KAF0320664.1 hypothetical protein GQ607_012061 [Colletotrichum asianum]KAF0326398.1 hypothetical protein GQ607_006298 [Colletotrichum asianum]